MDGQIRISYKRTRPNPLFQDWLMELHEESVRKRCKSEPMLKEALISLSKYPLPLESGAECFILKGFKKRLCRYLDQRLDVYRSKFNLQNYDINTKQLKTFNTLENCSSDSSASLEKFNFSNYNKNHSYNLISNEEVQGKVAQNQQYPTISIDDYEISASSSSYEPPPNTGSYSILLALFDETQKNPKKPHLVVEDLKSKAQQYCTSFYSDSVINPWNDIVTLEGKGYVKKRRQKKLAYSLTDSGLVLAEKLYKQYKFDVANCGNSSENLPTYDLTSDDCPLNVVSQPQKAFSSRSANSETPEVIDFKAGTFDIILLIDVHESGGSTKKSDPSVNVFKTFPDLNHDYRSLKVGDFTWIARHRESKDKELVLPYIVERKRMDDLSSSIRDGRFNEQKFRLRKCGVKNVIYLIENYGKNTHVQLPLQTLRQAMRNTRVQDGFKIHVTDSLDESARFLAIMTKRLTIRYKDKNLRGTNYDTNGEDLLIFDYFNKASLKTKALTVTEMFIKILLQLKGLSVEKAVAIVNVYNTPRKLIEAYKNCNETQGRWLLANLKYGDMNRKVGPTLSNIIYLLFTAENFAST